MRCNHFLLVGLIAVAGCAGIPTQHGFEQTLQSWQGGDINALIGTWGPPTRTDELPNGTKMYTFSRSGAYTTPVYVTPTYTAPSRTTVNVYGNTAYATTTPGQTTGGQVYGGQTVVTSCTVSFTTDASQRVIAWRYEGNQCRAPERQLDTNPETKKPKDVTLNEKKGWVKVISELNGCVGISEITPSKTEGVREFYNVSCSNKNIEIQCEFIGPVFSGYKGVPFVKVTGKSYDNQPACWQ